jgi:hypothetical protein
MTSGILFPSPVLAFAAITMAVDSLGNLHEGVAYVGVRGEVDCYCVSEFPVNMFARSQTSLWVQHLKYRLRAHDNSQAHDPQFEIIAAVTVKKTLPSDI